MAPVLPGLLWSLSPAVDTHAWANLWADNQWPAALQATLVSAFVGTALACAVVAGVATSLYPGARWLRLQHRLPWLLAIPHAAFAVGLFFLMAPSGWLARLVAWPLAWTAPPDWVTVQDPHGLALALALALKESWFLLWVLMALLSEQATSRQLLLARSLGYGRLQAWRLVLWPQLVPRLAWPLAAVMAYSLSVVDMAVVLGPGNPPTAAVLAWRWLADPSTSTQAMGAVAAMTLLGVFVGISVLAWACWLAVQRWQRRASYPMGHRHPGAGAAGGLWRWLPWLLEASGVAVLMILALWSVADGWFFPAWWPAALSGQAWERTDPGPMLTTLWVGAASCLVCLPAALVWLEWGSRRHQAMLYAPLILPALPLAAGQYATLLHAGLDGTATGLVWSHLLWVLPYMLLTLVGPYRAFDPRLATTARALGHTRWQTCVLVKWPLLQRPIAASVAVGFAVSVAQYLPTLFAGGGRFATVTTEAVTLSAGGSRSVLAVQALLQVVLPLAAFALATGLPRWLLRNRRGMT